MIKKITSKSKVTVKPFYILALLSWLWPAGHLLAQTVTEVFPTRVTSKSKVTLIGTGFTTTTAIAVNGISVASNSIKLISNTELTFQISHSGASDITGNLSVEGVSTPNTITYVAPTPKLLKNGAGSNVTKITEIFTTYNGFWRSSQWKAAPNNNDLKPNTSHDLLAFTYDGITYSTGVNDALLTANRVIFNKQLFYAYTTNGVDGVTQTFNYLAMADLIDGQVAEGTEITSPNILSTTIYEAITDGVNGLDLGTGVTNFNQAVDVKFYSSGGRLGAVNDGAPDFLISQIAMAGSTDIYYYADDMGNVLGRPIKLTILEENANDGDALLARWRLDLFSFANGLNYGLATPSLRAFSNNEERPLRMAAFRFEEFGIDASTIERINNVNMVAGGTADLAFIAYNRGSFDNRIPVFTQFPVSRSICKLPSTSSITFSATAIVGGDAVGDPEETLTYQWYKYNTPIEGATSSSYTISGNIELGHLGTYKLKVSNDFGSIIAPLSFTQGGTPTFWNGTSWELPPGYAQAGIVVSDQDKALVFSSDYNEAGDLEGCDCTVNSGANVTIPSGATLKLYNTMVVQSGGAFKLQDNASLIQTKEVPINLNTGSIQVERKVFNLHTDDVVFWSSPVDAYDVTGISAPYTTSNGQYHVNQLNAEGRVGDWVAASGLMAEGEGYSIQVPNAFVSSGFTAVFTGKARNGTFTVNVSKSITTNQPSEERRHWNLLGNPYPSAINVEAFLAANPSLEGHVKLWSHRSATGHSAPISFYTDFVYDYGTQYVTYNRTGATPDVFNGNIVSGQGFFVQVDNASAVSPVVFKNSMRFDEAENGYDNSGFSENGMPSVSDDNKQLLWLSLINENQSSSTTLVGYLEGATNGLDKHYDARSDGGAMSIYSIVMDRKMAIQGRFPFTVSDVVPLGVDIPSNGIYSIGIDHLKGALFAAQQQGIYLEDTYLETVHDLKASPYRFTVTAGDVKDRFILRYTDQQLSVVERQRKETFAFVKNAQLHVSALKNIDAIVVYDLTGKKLMDYDISGNSDSVAVPFQFSKGVYMTVITLENTGSVAKRVIN